jgi:hypothetical protein
MKTSKIIFISLLCLIALITLAATISVRINGVKIDEVNRLLRKTEIPLQAYSVIDMKSCENISLTEGSTSKIEVLVSEDSLNPKIDYTVENDTLFITGLRCNPSSRLYIKVYIDPDLKTIWLKNSNITIVKCNYKKLSIFLDSSRLNSVLNYKENNSISNMIVKANNRSSVVLYSMDVDSANLVLQNSTTNLKISPKFISGILSENSKLTTQQPGEISVKRDSTSKIMLNEY